MKTPENLSVAACPLDPAQLQAIGHRSRARVESAPTSLKPAQRDTSEHEPAEAAPRESEMKASTCIEDAPIAIFVEQPAHCGAEVTSRSRNQSWFGGLLTFSGTGQLLRASCSL